jgi:universal stress protein A
MVRFSRILCPVDFDPNSASALRTASELAQHWKAALVVLHTIPIPPGPEVALDFRKIEATATNRLERLARQRVNGRARYQVAVLMGDPASEILQAARKHRVNLIVMATHGRKGLRRVVLGSVTEKVVRDAPCPVLTLKPKNTARAATWSPGGSKHMPERKLLA